MQHKAETSKALYLARLSFFSHVVFAGATKKFKQSNYGRCNLAGSIAPAQERESVSCPGTACLPLVKVTAAMVAVVVDMGGSTE